MSEYRYDAATAIGLGRRDHQEDALVADFPQGGEIGFAVLADGMGGHAGGDVASKIVVTEVFSELKFRSNDGPELEKNLPAILHDAARAANECLRHHTEAEPQSRGMGTTLVAPILCENRLYWISVGDSPLYLFRDGILTRLNEDHSMAPQIDYMVEQGLMESEEARDHPDRNALTSVLYGADIPRIDCPAAPLKLRSGDLVVVSSDGLQFLEDEEIATLLRAAGEARSSEISAALLEAVEALEDPDQDNVSICVIRVHGPARTERVTTRPLFESHGNRRLRVAGDEDGAKSPDLTERYG